MKKILGLFFALWSFQASGCHCSYPILAENYQSSGYVALVRIMKATPDPESDSYLNVEIEQLNLYKGKGTPTLKINTMANTSCAFSLPEGSTWLVFAKLDQKGIPGFGPCSGSQQLDRFDPIQHPKAASNDKKSIELKLATLDFIKKKNLDSFNPYHLTLFSLGGCDENIKGYENQRRFAVYEIDVSEDLSIKKITALQEFNNAELAQRLLECLRKNTRINNTNTKGIPTKTKMFVIYYHYPAEGNDPSFVGKFDL
ncbi:hypothetical protein [Persicitalea jodogahamensis]|uniref:Tissue inhibitor of metalloproteinase n=1 Tax=Persicitalea jodogahamensis TaxID=402147 RepID=A0A8J3GBY2_9BACT|nr:hypothetical protein [Persicitalea jodogahamensis]GHB85094.1 hypothetical protein GCM10007390_45480 [Persicitalea jodogahamensis]